MSSRGRASKFMFVLALSLFKFICEIRKKQQYNQNIMENNQKSFSQQEQKKTQDKKPEDVQQQCFDPADLLQNYMSMIPKLISKPIDRKKHKGTNIPKFLLKVFFNNMPEFPDKQHIERLINFIKRPEKSKTRFHLVQLFGSGSNSRIQRENQLNRRVLKRLLARNYDNILINKHIRNKRLYLLFCKKMLLRLNKPELIDRLEI